MSIKPHSPDTNGGDSWPRRAAVVGGGAMGAGFAQLFALAQIPCAIADASAELAAAARERAVAQAERFEADGLLDAGGCARIAANTVAASSIEDAVAQADITIEAVAEDVAVKRDVLAQVERASPLDAILATNTSAIPIRVLSAELKRPERFLGTHWFNPPQWVPGVELIPSPSTEPDVVERVLALLRRLGKHAAVVGDGAGFVANRIQFAMFKEALAVVADGVATPSQVDEIVRSSFGFRLPFFGPFAIADMAGLDVYAGAYGALEEDLGPRFAAPASLLELVREGRLGTKQGGGFLDLEPGAVPALQAHRDRAYVALERLREQLDDVAGR